MHSHFLSINNPWNSNVNALYAWAVLLWVLGPEICIGCPLQVDAIDVTEEYAHTSVTHLDVPDFLEDLQGLYPIATNLSDSRRRFVKEVFLGVYTSIMKTLSERRKSITSCPLYRRTSVEER